MNCMQSGRSLQLKEFMELDPNIPAQNTILKKAKEGLPMNISLAN